MPNPADPQALNRYAYCLNNPLKYTDPSGHFVPLVLLGISIYYWIAAGGALAVWGWWCTNYGDEMSHALNEAIDVMFSKHGGQSDKSLQDGVDTLIDVIRKHEKKSRENPNSPDVPTWKNHIEKAKDNIRKNLDKMGPKARQETEKRLRDAGMEISRSVSLPAGSSLDSYSYGSSSYSYSSSGFFSYSSSSYSSSSDGSWSCFYYSYSSYGSFSYSYSYSP